jgi:hypothetical protein
MTVVWCAKIGLLFLNQGLRTLEQKVEWGLVVVFMINLLHLLIKWKIKHQDIKEADVLASQHGCLVAYCYLLICMTTRN